MEQAFQQGRNSGIVVERNFKLQKCNSPFLSVSIIVAHFKYIYGEKCASPSSVARWWTRTVVPIFACSTISLTAFLSDPHHFCHMTNERHNLMVHFILSQWHWRDSVIKSGGVRSNQPHVDATVQCNCGHDNVVVKQLPVGGKYITRWQLIIPSLFLSRAFRGKEIAFPRSITGSTIPFLEGFVGHTVASKSFYVLITLTGTICVWCENDAVAVCSSVWGPISTRASSSVDWVFGGKNYTNKLQWGWYVLLSMCTTYWGIRVEHSFFVVAPTAVRLGKETHLVRTGDCPGCVQYPKECSFR